MIFVTVGTTMPFDSLLEAVDSAARTGLLKGRVVCQTGTSAYQPQHCEWFDFRPSLGAWMEEADAIFGHGGTGTVFEMLGYGKPFIAFANLLAAHDHQREFLQGLEKVCDLLWTDDPATLPALLERLWDHQARPFSEARLHDDLTTYLEA